MNPAKPRRIVLINPRYQLRLAGAFLAVQILLTGIFAGGLYLFLDSELQASLASAHARFLALDRMLLPIVALLSCFSLALSTVLVTIFVVLLSHRLAGPLYRFRTALEALAERRFDPHTRLRQDDQFGEVADSLGKALGTVSTDLEDLRAAVAAGKAGSASPGETLDRIERILAAWRQGN
jgi:signal transduction histidine kinase